MKKIYTFFYKQHFDKQRQTEIGNNKKKQTNKKKN